MFPLRNCQGPVFHRCRHCGRCGYATFPPAFGVGSSFYVSRDSRCAGGISSWLQFAAPWWRVVNILLSSLVTRLFLPFAHFVAGLCISFLLSSERPLYILDTSALPDTWFVNLFSQPVACLSVCDTSVFCGPKVFNLRKSNLLTYGLCFWCHACVRTLILGQKDTYNFMPYV